MAGFRCAIKAGFALFASALLACFFAAAPSFALKTLTDEELTRISGQTGITISGSLNLRAETTRGFLDLDSRANEHYVEIKDGSYYDAPYGTTTSTLRNDSDSIAMTLGGGTFDSSSAHTWQPAKFDPITLTLDVGTAAGTGSMLVLSATNVSNVSGNELYLKADRLEVNDSAHNNQFIFGLDLGPITFPNFGNAADIGNPIDLIIAPGYNGQGAGVKGQLAMKLRIDNIGLTRNNPGIDRGVGLLFCGNFTDDPNATAFTSNWNPDYWEANTATGQFSVGKYATDPLSIEAATYGGNTYIVLRACGNMTHTVNYRDIDLSNMGATTVWYDSSNTRHISNPDGYVMHHFIGEVRLQRIEGHVGGTLRSIGGLALEDLDMVYTEIVIPTNANGTAPFVPPNIFRTSGGTMPTAANIGNTTQLPGGITWNGTF